MDVIIGDPGPPLKAGRGMAATLVLLSLTRKCILQFIEEMERLESRLD